MLQRALLWFAFFQAVTAIAAPWPESLYLGNGGFWPVRVKITITNKSPAAVEGTPVECSMPSLTGARIESLRAARADGVELLFDVRNAAGAPKRSGALDADDRFRIPVECKPNGVQTIFVYAENQNALPVPDFLETQRTNAPTSLEAVVGDVERLRLEQAPTLARSPSVPWAEARVRNFGDEPIAAALVRVNVRAAISRLPGLPLQSPPRVIGSNGSLIDSFTLGRDLFFQVALPPRTEQSFQLQFDGRGRDPGAGPADYERWLTHQANLVENGDFEFPGDWPAGWTQPASSSGAKASARVVGDARFGKRALELTIPTNETAAWIGWHSQPIRVRPGGKYILSGWLKGVGLQSSASIHAHFHDAAGALTKSAAMASTQPPVSGNSDWARTQAVLQAPPDAASIQLHLTMNSAGTLRHDGILLSEILEGQLGSVHAGAADRGQGEFRVWEVSPLIKVFPDTPPQADAQTVAVELAQNEFEPFQLALRGLTQQVTISVSSLRRQNGRELPPVKIDRVGFVPIDHPSGYYSTDVASWVRKVPRGAGSTDGWAGWWPDPLAPCSALALAPGQTQPLWFTVQAPASAEPGLYRAEISFAREGKALAILPLTVTVLPFALPQTTRLRAVFDFRFGPGRGFGSGADTLEQRRQWLRFMADHRLGIDAIRPEPRFSYAEGKVTMDAREFDEIARICFDELKMNVCYTPHFFYMFGWAYPPKKFFGLEPFTPEWTSAFKQAYRLFSDHLREKAWRDKFVYYISDEPHFQHDFVVEQMKQLCALIHEVDATIPIYSSTWRHCAAWDQSLDIWGVGQYGSFPVEAMEQVHQAKKRFWFTCDGQMATDTPYLATERMLPYYCYKYGAEGFEFWGLAWWTYDPWQIGWHQFIRQSDEGKKYYWIRYPNGDGYLAYPGKAVGVEGPVSTIRLEQVREGLEDYEAIQLLSARARATRDAGQPSTAAERALQMAKDLVTIPNAGGLRSTEILPDPFQISRIRKAVNQELSKR